VAKLLARHVRAVRAHDPDWAPGLPVTPHTLRRSRAMHLVQAGVNLIYIRDLLGHADVSTTEIYARADAETKRLRAAHPRHPAGLDPRLVPDRLARLTRPLTRAQHYADHSTSSAAPTSGNTTAGRITQPSA
jgi:hypothetical protein